MVISILQNNPTANNLRTKPFSSIITSENVNCKHHVSLPFKDYSKKVNAFSEMRLSQFFFKESLKQKQVVEQVFEKQSELLERCDEEITK